jgi:hypothetical protein
MNEGICSTIILKGLGGSWNILRRNSRIRHLVYCSTRNVAQRSVRMLNGRRLACVFGAPESRFRLLIGLKIVCKIFIKMDLDQNIESVKELCR